MDPPRRRERLTTALLLAPVGACYLVLLILPLVVVLVFSLGERAPAGGYAPAFTLAQFANLPARWTAFRNTLMLAPVGTLACLAIGYPLAYFLALRASPRRPASDRRASDRRAGRADPRRCEWEARGPRPGEP